MKNILEVERLNKFYSLGKTAKHHVLKDINLRIEMGEFVSVMGPSGSGKSTLLYTVSGMDKMTSGSVKLAGKEIADLSEEELTKLRLYKMGFVFQQSTLIRNLNIFDNIILSAYLAKTDNRQKINKRASELMKRTGIADLSDRDITQVSGGQLQRVSICRALINNPDIIFGDEPTGALNSQATNEVMDILSNINQSGTTILLVTHDVKVAAKTGRVLFMLDGRISCEKNLGKYQKEKDDIRAREEELLRWLSQIGF
ncbi:MULTISPECIES: ABC transporter ATP-binding protein [Bacillus cereus group]|uniref:ABC transporter ATP-binding protein n=1 Tax=Bacillus cereus TaxID=1396 RepID=A0AA44Q6S6_BACCE|nr:MULTISPECIES: ABC transporter ATP-binding protein [Bacillus cereus group]PFN08765.1 ABC transporter ATP-binding protein [Bacillus cereus]PFO79914.1 ABC transporter ATP-binding protein [Bacillus cereus]PFR92765.1 ABC transporter ATP-binding protein [Bacillus cereus]